MAELRGLPDPPNSPQRALQGDPRDSVPPLDETDPFSTPVWYFQNGTTSLAAEIATAMLSSSPCKNRTATEYFWT